MIDEGVRECLAIEVDTSLRAERVVKVLERLKERRGTPQMIRLDNVLTRKSSTRFGNTPSHCFNLLALASAATELKNLRPLARRAPRVLDFCLASAQGQLQGSFRSPD